MFGIFPMHRYNIPFKNDNMLLKAVAMFISQSHVYFFIHLPQTVYFLNKINQRKSRCNIESNGNKTYTTFERRFCEVESNRPLLSDEKGFT